MEVVHEEPTNHDQIQTLTMLEQIKEQQIVNDNFKDGKTVADEGQWSIVSGNMKKFNNMEKVTLIQQTNSVRNRPWGHRKFVF